MTAKINLLPWREEFRQQKKQEFIKVGVIIAVIALVVVGMWDRVINVDIDRQTQRNQFLTSSIAELEKSVKEIAELKSRRQELLDRMTVIQALQANRPEIVRMFDEMASATPEGVFLVDLNRVGGNISLQGFSESNNRVSSFMRNLTESYKFSEPNLTKVLADERLGEQGNTFDLRVKITEPKALEDGDGEAVDDVSSKGQGG